MAVKHDDWDSLLAFDREHVWHPYAPLAATPAPLPVVSARGVRLKLADGRELIDGMASWWCAIHGYRHPELDRAVGEQLQRMAHVMFGGLTHEPAVRLAERLLALTPPSLQAVFFADSGSVSVEVAIKMCLQFQRARGHRGRTRLLTVRGGYHGDTFGAMAVCDPVGGMHSLFAGVLAEHVFAERPPDGFDAGLDERWAAHVRELVARHAHELAAIVVEPVVQGAGGMRFHSPACVALLRELCDEHGLLLVLDEIATGFGRTGELFACEHADVAPDVMCVGKALTGGYMTLAATLCTRAVADAVSAGEGGGLAHGPTFMANPLACSVALASLDLLLDDAEGGGWRSRVGAIERGLRDGLEPARELPGVVDVRVLGAIGVVQLDREVDIATATAAAVQRGVWLRPFRDLIYAMPPYVIEQDDLARVSAAIVDGARAASG
ncbi:MAG: adenosylmethionine---8-amino-7-oxononanoate aminotransferase [Solirubrobacteraceae bacterium]|jgi:adenosylmethionine-8-amino-7-oxononanoate aminotransferase|nr:adenosylmethionine---8-amino-7-oxononanoate aminotransferase [Solirubrobacteraceae bacterium]